MFDYVILPESVKCPGCGHDLGDHAQTKDRAWPSLDKYHLNELYEAEIDQFYFLCESCHGWVQFDRKMPREQLLGQFDMKFTKYQESKPG